MIKKIILSSVFFLPGILFAADILDLVGAVGGWVEAIGKVIFMAVIAAFFWGLFLFVMGGDSKREEGKSTMVWGVVAIFVMTSIWGIVAMLQDSTKVGNGGFDSTGLSVDRLLPR